MPVWAILAGWATVALYLGAVGYTWWLWRSSSAPGDQDKELGAHAVWTQLNAGLTAASILLPASFVIVGLGRGLENPMPTAALTQVVLAAAWFTAAILVGVWNAGLLVRQATKINVSQDAITNILLAAQLFLVLFGAINLMLTLFLI